MQNQEKRSLFTDNGDKLFARLKRGIQIMKEPHIHSGYELYFCPENIPQRSVICGIGYEHSYPTVILSKPYTIHSMSCLEDCKTDYKRYVIYFSENMVSELGINLFPSEIFEGKMGLLFKLDVKDAEYLETIIQFFVDKEHPLSESEQKLLLSFFLHRLYSLTKAGGIEGVGTSSYYVQNVLKYISKHFAEDIDSLHLATAFSVSRSKLDRDFKNALGETAKVFIESCRLTYAKKLLTADNGIKIAEIAELCGFTSDTYFYRFFKRHTGLTPLEYKNIYYSKEN